MRIKQTTGRVVHSPLNLIFQMTVLGGSARQQYDTAYQTYEPNRSITPLLLQPKLTVSDPDGTLTAGDYTHKLVNAAWTLKTCVQGQSAWQTLASAGNYSVNASTKALTLMYNVPTGSALRLSFHAEFLDTRRNETHPVNWETDLTTEARIGHNLSLDTGRWASKVRLSPFKNWGKFQIQVQMKDGTDDIQDSRVQYTWEWWDEESHAWKSDMSEQPWCVSGNQTKAITVDQDYIENVLLRVTATAFGDSTTTRRFVTRLKRWYGMYEEEVEFVTGKYIFHDTTMVALEGKVTNRQGDITSICRYFDCGLYFAVGNEPMTLVAYGVEAIVRRQDLAQGTPRAGILCRELTAMRGMEDPDGNILTTEDGAVLVARFPTTPIEEEA